MTHERAGGEAYLLPRLRRALISAGGTHDWQDVLQRIATGQAQYWETPDGRGALVTEVLRFPNLSVVNYWLAAGELHACHSLVPTIESWARAQGCTRGIGMGRPGFARLLGPEGVTVGGVAYRKELGP
jgi:hypothetical protein